MASAGEPGAKTGPSLPVRILRAFRALTRDQRMSAVAALALWITMFLPWYSVTVAKGVAGASLSAWSAFGLVQVLVLLISLGTLVLLFFRGERRALGAHSADTALLVTILGSVAAIAVLWGIFDRPGGALAVASGIGWGIVIALLAAIWLAWTGFSAYRRDRGAGPPPAVEARPEERRLTRRERTGGGEPPEAARWVEPSRETAPRDPPPTRGERGRHRDDATQLSLELPHDHYDE
jgi:hypothetical protein